MKHGAPVSVKPTIDAPAAWRWTPLQEVARLESGHTPSRRHPEYWDGDIPWLSLKDIQGLHGAYVYETQDMPTSLGIENSSARVLPKGTVALCRTASVGKVAILGRDMATSQDFVDWVCGPSLHSEYLYWALRASAATFELEKQGSTHKTIYMPVLERLQVLLPPIEEQRRIAAILDKADAIRRKRQEALALTDQLLRSTFLDMFGDPVTNPKGWPVVPLSQLGNLERGRSTHRPRNDPSLLGGEHPLIQTGDVAASGGVIQHFSQTYSELGLQQSRKWEAGTLCITIAANIARTGILAFDACFPDSVVGFTAGSDVDVEYIQGCFSFLQSTIEASADQVAQKNINLAFLRALGIPLPNSELTFRYGESARILRKRQLLLVRSAADAEALYQSLTHRAFTGQL